MSTLKIIFRPVQLDVLQINPQNAFFWLGYYQLIKTKAKSRKENERDLFCISTSERMLAHAFAWLKLTENIGK